MVKMVYENEAHQSELLSALKEMYDCGLMVDITLRVDDTEFRCHKNVLSASCPYFRAMFSCNLSESKEDRVSFHGLVDAESLKLILEYCYSGKLEIDIGTAQGLLTAATLFQILPVQTACAKFMQNELDVSNCIGIYCFALIHNCEELKTAAKAFVEKNFTETITGEEFMTLETDRLVEFISSDDLDVESEEVVFNCIMKWLQFDLENRKDDIDKLVDYIRFGLLSPKFRQENLECNEILNNSQKFKEILEEVREIESSFHQSSSSLEKSVYATLRLGMIRPDMCIILVGGVDHNRPSINCYNPLTREAFILADGDFRGGERSFNSFDIEDPGCVVTPDNQIFVAGGNYMYKDSYFNDFSDDDSFDGYDSEETLSRDVFWYDNDRDEWIPRAPMLFPKSNFSLACVNGKLYCFGGLTINQHPTEIVESYDIANNRWNYVGMMPTKLVDLSTVTHGHLIYLIGGRTGVGAHNILISYDHRNNEWISLSGMPTPRFHFGATVIGDEIYTVGGQIYSHTSRTILREALTSVEIYNIEQDQWRHGPELPVPMFHVGLSIVNNALYACGTSLPQRNNNLNHAGVSSVKPRNYRLVIVYRLKLNVPSGWECLEDDLCDIRDYKCIAAKIQTRKLSQMFRPEVDM